MKKILIALLILIVLAVIAVPLVWLYTPDATIASKVQQSTGRSFEITGSTTRTIFPWLGLELDGMTVGNAAGFGETPFLKTGPVKVRVKLLPLLSKKIEMDTIRVVNAEINLAVNAEGTSNWDDLVDPEKKSEPISLGALALGGVDIQNARITYNDAAAGKLMFVKELNATTGPLAMGEAIDVKVTANAGANKPALTGDIALAGTVTYDLDDGLLLLEPLNLTAKLKGKNLPGGADDLALTGAVTLNLDDQTVNITDLQFSGLDTRVGGSLMAEGIKSDTPSIVAELNGSGADLSTLFKVMENPLADQLSRLNDKSFDFSGTLEAVMEADKINMGRVSELSANLLGANVTGTVEGMDLATEKPILGGDLLAKGPDLPTLLRVIGAFETGKNPKLANVGKSIAGAPKKFEVSTRFDADMNTGEVVVPELSIEALGSKITGKLEGSRMGTDTPSINGELKGSGSDLPAWLRALGELQEDGAAMRERGAALAKLRDKSFDFATRFDANLKSGNVDVPVLTANALGATLSGRLKGTGVKGMTKGTLDGQLSLRGGKELKPVLVALDNKGLSEVLNSLAADAGISGSMSDLSLKPLQIKLSVASGNTPVDLTFTSSAQLNMDKQTASLSNMSVKGLGLNLQGNIDAKKIIDAPEYSGTLTVTPFNLRSFMAKLNQAPPVTADPKVLTKVALNTKLAGTAKSIKLSGLTMVLDDTNLNGDLSVDNFDDPDINFKFAINNLNADRYMAPTDPNKKVVITPETAAAGAAGQPIEKLRALKVNGDLSIGTLQFSGAKMSGVKLSIKARDGKINVNPIAAALYGGTYTGNVNIDATGTQAQVLIGTSLAGVQAEPLLVDMTKKPSPVVGTANFAAKLNAVGTDANYIKRTLGGQANFRVIDGAYRGVDIAQVLYQVETMIERKNFGAINRGEITRFEELTGTLNFNRGVVTNNDLLLKAPGLKVTGSGTVGNLVSERIKYDLIASVDAATVENGQDKVNLGGYSLPFRCNGTFASPGCAPDISGIAGAIAKRQVQDVIKDKVGGDVGEALKGILNF